MTLDKAVSFHHDILKQKLSTRFTKLTNAFRLVDSDGSGTCDRRELHRMLNHLSPAASNEVLDRIIDLADYDGDGVIKYAEFARVFTEENVHKMKRTLSAFDMSQLGERNEYVDRRAPVSAFPSKIKGHHSHFPPASVIPVNDAWDMPRYVSRKLTSSRGPRLEPALRERHLGVRPVFRAAARKNGFVVNPNAPAGRSSGPREPLSLSWSLPTLSPTGAAVSSM